MFVFPSLQSLRPHFGSFAWSYNSLQRVRALVRASLAVPILNPGIGIFVPCSGTNMPNTNFRGNELGRNFAVSLISGVICQSLIRISMSTFETNLFSKTYNICARTITLNLWYFRGTQKQGSKFAVRTALHQHRQNQIFGAPAPGFCVARSKIIFSVSRMT